MEAKAENNVKGVPGTLVEPLVDFNQTHPQDKQKHDSKEKDDENAR